MEVWGAVKAGLVALALILAPPQHGGVLLGGEGPWPGMPLPPSVLPHMADAKMGMDGGEACLRSLEKRPGG